MKTLCFMSIILMSFNIVNTHGTDISDDIAEYKAIANSDSTVGRAIYADTAASPAERAYDLIRRMTLEEKISMTGGWNKFMIPGIPRLGVRGVSMADASQGIRLQTAYIKDKSTSFPCMLALASTWNPHLVYDMAKCLSKECRSHGVDILLGPGMNMQRLSVGGRNFEYMGEDPYLTSEISFAYLKSFHDNNVIAVAKHFICNDQEFCRHIANSIVGERAFREIYFYPWEKAIEKGVCHAIMTGNNMAGGIPCCMNKTLLTDLLRTELGFDGTIMTDWQNSSYFPERQNLVLHSGINLLMPDNNTFRQYIDDEIRKSESRKNEVEIMLEHMIYPTVHTLFKAGVYDRPFASSITDDDMEFHKHIAEKCALEAPVLLKNDNILPLRPGQKILLAGPCEIHSGTGSGYVEGYDHVSYLDGLMSIYGDNVKYERFPDHSSLNDADVIIYLLSKDAGESKDIPFEEPVDQIDDIRKIAAVNDNVIVLVNACNTFPSDWINDVKGLVWCYFLGQERGDALAKLLSGEENFSGKLPFTVERSFSESPAPDFNRLGNKPYWGGDSKVYKKYWMGTSAKKIPGFSEYVKPGQNVDIDYSEGIFTGYRWYDRHDIDVVYPFGYGLSYTSFSYNNIVCENKMESEGLISVSIDVKNTGSCIGKETVQIYVEDCESDVERPVKELKAFKKITIAPGETVTVNFSLDRKSFSYWDEINHEWVLEPGRFVIHAGKSSGELLLQTEIILN